MVWLLTVLIRSVVLSMYRLIGASIRIIDDPIDRFRRYRRQGTRVIFGVWHEYSVVGIYWYRHKGGSALVEDSWRGDVLAYILNHFGFMDFRISSRNRPKKSARGVLGFIRYLKKGHDGTIAMDGPLGPARVPKPGIIHIAGKSGNVIVPAGAWFSHSITFRKRWDNYQIPLPFARLHLHFGEPIVIPPDYRSREAELLEQVRRATDEAAALAEHKGRTYRRRRGA
ncbi:MAG: DUF374 domain-containing protein [Spirochaetaceae bacterium]|nr:MAG: DUF374 domain-containing protein [Spirochaetaceae bacterium]